MLCASIQGSLYILLKVMFSCNKQETRMRVPRDKIFVLKESTKNPVYWHTGYILCIFFIRRLYSLVTNETRQRVPRDKIFVLKGSTKNPVYPHTRYILSLYFLLLKKVMFSCNKQEIRQRVPRDKRDFLVLEVQRILYIGIPRMNKDVLSSQGYVLL